MRYLPLGLKYKTTNIFPVSHIVPTNREIKETKKNIGNMTNIFFVSLISLLSRDKHAITSLSLMYKISTVCKFTIYHGRKRTKNKQTNKKKHIGINFHFIVN